MLLSHLVKTIFFVEKQKRRLRRYLSVLLFESQPSTKLHWVVWGRKKKKWRDKTVTSEVLSHIAKLMREEGRRWASEAEPAGEWPQRQILVRADRAVVSWQCRLHSGDVFRRHRLSFTSSTEKTRVSAERRAGGRESLRQIDFYHQSSEKDELN